MRAFLFFLFLFAAKTVDCQEITFSNSPKKYRIKEYLFDGRQSIYDVPIEIEFEINLKKDRNSSSTEKIFNISFGCDFDACKEKIRFSNDTIYYYPQGCLKPSPLFVLNDSSNIDTIHVDEFCFLSNYDVVFKKVCYFSAIRDTVYVYTLLQQKPNRNNRTTITSSSSEDQFYINEIAINKAYGFIWVKYLYHGVNYEVRFR